MFRSPTSASVTQPPTGQQAFFQAVRDGAPLAVSVLAYGLVYGALARGTVQLTFVQTMSLSTFLFAGASQMLVLSLLHQDVPTLSIIVSTFLVNARQFLYGVSLGPALRSVRKRALLFLAHGLTDESYSVSAVQAQGSPLTAAYFAGAGAAVFIPWQVSSAVGYLISGGIGNPGRLGLDFAYIGAFLGLLMAQLKHRSHVVTAVIAAVAATAAARWGGTSTAVIAGAGVSILMGVMQHERE